MLARSAEALLASLIDYAGLFPPASLSMEEAVRRYDAYRRGEHAWMLGKFIVPAARLHEVPTDFPVSVLADEVREFDRDVASIEIKCHPERSEGPGRLGGTTARPHTPRSLATLGMTPSVYVEIPIADDPLPLLEQIKAAGAHAKMRTGGVTPDAFPSVEHVARFIQRCEEARVAFKATAGLHHPVRCVKALTYEADAPRGTMHGFLNVFLAALFVDAAIDILADDDPHSFAFDDAGLTWRGRRASIAEITSMRRDFAHSFGSCSFEEPVADLKELGWL